jgi:hypothetical protein
MSDLIERLWHAADYPDVRPISSDLVKEAADEIMRLAAIVNSARRRIQLGGDLDSVRRALEPLAAREPGVPEWSSYVPPTSPGGGPLAIKALVAAEPTEPESPTPACAECGRPATYRLGSPTPAWCDAHGPKPTDEEVSRA